MTPKQVAEIIPWLTPQERAELNALIGQDIQEIPWRPLPGPQTMAFESLADVIGYGGAAGGGKTDLAIGKALCHHHRAQIFRLEGPQLLGIIDRMAEILGTRDGLAGKPPVWRVPSRDVVVEFGSVPNLGDETKFQGRPKDLLVIDEAANFLEQVVRFLMGWVRSTRPGQRQQTLLTFNPPTSAEGRWILDFFGPWLQEKHPLYPTAPGALRWVYVDPDTGKDVWIADDDSRPFVLIGGQRCYDFKPADYRPEEIIQPKSRTFIPARVTDNPFLVGTGYMAQLQAMPEPLRSQMLNGDFKAGMKDDPWQVIPTSWVERAMKRWRDRSPRGEMMAVGVDVARGGEDNTIIVSRHELPGGGRWFSPLQVEPGKETPEGYTVAALVMAMLRDDAPINLDVIGVGASPYDILRNTRMPVVGVNVAASATKHDKTGRLEFFNLRSQVWWLMREALDPANDMGTELPDDPQLLVELCAPKWTMSGTTIRVESREEIIKRIGRSPDRATAVVLANMDSPKVRNLDASKGHRSVIESVLSYNPVDSIRT